ncbi:hypothetical protein PBAC_02310 [Pedobacter glucosidilyticus]|jgi:uncharacterized membrane protein|nr:hypothetical protein PBAC_02310 [Pedobacter glucosidilyticus]
MAYSLRNFLRENGPDIMKTLLNILAMLFVLGWGLGVFVFTAGILIHILLVLGVFTMIINLLSEEESTG